MMGVFGIDYSNVGSHFLILLLLITTTCIHTYSTNRVSQATQHTHCRREESEL